MIRFFLIIVIQAIVINSFSPNYYVSTNGNDNDNGLSIDHTFLTISKIINTVQAGDTAFILGGTYSLNQTTVTSGTEDNPIVIKAYENQIVKLEGTGNTNNGGRFRLKHSWYVIEGIEFLNAVNLYNQKRLHLSLNYKTPNMVYNKTA